MCEAYNYPRSTPAAPLPPSINALPRDSEARIAERQPGEPIHLAGWSVGGIIAQATATALAAAGRTVGLLALLDAYPADRWRNEPEPTEAEALRALLAIAGHDPTAHPELVIRADMLAFLRAGGSPLGSLPPATLTGMVRAVLDTNRLVRGHHHDRSPPRSPMSAPRSTTPTDPI